MGNVKRFKEKCDFSGWATKNDLRCADGLVIRKDAFSANDGKVVPLVYNHGHKSIHDVLGHALLENRDEGVYAYCFLNNTRQGQDAKETVQNGDIISMSIWADGLDRNGSDVLHGNIREVSIVLAGANPGAFIESVAAHGICIDDEDEEGYIYTGEPINIGSEIQHAAPEQKKEDPEPKSEKPKTVGEVYNAMTDEQKTAVGDLVAQAVASFMEESEKDNPGGNDKNKEKEGGTTMSHNIFESGSGQQGIKFISHSDEQKILEDAKSRGSLRAVIKDTLGDDEYIRHSIPTDGMTLATGEQTYGFNDPEMLFPDFKAVNGETPEFLSRNMEWVAKVLAQVHHTPFSRIKSIYANITEDEARAKGYIKGKQKKEEVFSLLKRTTSPQLIYKKQKLDRQDILQITSFDIVSWIRGEMKVMLNEEIARAILIGDGRSSDSEDKIDEKCIRPVVTDASLYNVIIKVTVPANATESEIAKATINAVLRARKKYKGSGSPTFWTTDDVTTEMLLMEDQIGHKIYKTEAELATALRVKEIVPVEPMEGHVISITENSVVKQYPLIGTIVNLVDYNIGKDPGMEETNFQDFDIDYNQYKYLIETMMSGALIKPFSALTLVLDQPEPSSPGVGG